MENMTKKSAGWQRVFYKNYLKEKDELDAELMRLENERENICAPYNGEIRKLKSQGGENAAILTQQIAELQQKIDEVKVQYDQLEQDIESNTVNLQPNIQALEDKNANRRKKSSILKRLIPVAVVSHFCGILGHINHTKRVEEVSTQEYYLNHSDFAQSYTDAIKEYCLTNNLPLDAANVTPTNLMSKLDECFSTMAHQASATGSVSDAIYANVAYNTYMRSSREIVEEGLYAGHDAMVQAVPDLTAVGAVGGAVATAVIMSLPYFITRHKIKSFYDKQNKIEAKKIELITELETEKKEKISAIRTEISELEKQKTIAIVEDVKTQLPKIEDEKTKACALVDLQIERVKASGQLAYNNYLKQMAREGATSAVAIDVKSRPVRVGNVNRYESEMKAISDKITKIDEKISKATKASPSML